MNKNYPVFKKILLYASFSILILLSTLLAGEMAVRIAYPLVSNYDLEMWRYAAYGKAASGIPAMSHKHKPGVYFKNLYGVEVKINSKGLRDYEYSYKKPDNCYRILALGDSITFGWGVPFEKAYAKLLENKLNAAAKGTKYQIINCGVGNYQLSDELAFLKYEGLKYNPDMVILGYFVDDAKINAKVNYFGLKRHSYLYALLASRWNALRVSFDPGYNFLNYYSALYLPGSVTRRNLDANIDELKDICRKRNIRLVVMLIPELHNLKNYPFNNVREHVSAEFSGLANAKIVDLLPYFDKTLDPMVYWVSKEDAHHNSKAQAIMAEALYSEVFKSGNNLR